MCPRWNKVVNSTGVQPKPRHGHRAVAIKELIVIFGGGNEGMLPDLVVYNTQTNHWFKPTVKGTVPAGRASYGIVVDKTRIIVFGGMMEYMECTDEVFELQASRWEWKKLNPSPPPDLKPPPLPRLGHSFTIVGERIFLFGGLTLDSDNIEQNIYPRYLNDMYTLEWSKEILQWNIPVTYGKTPSPRESHSAISHVDSEGNPILVIYGGMSGCRLGDLWFFYVNSMTWFEMETTSIVPLPRSLHSATIVGDRMFVFGGWVPVTPNDCRATCYEKEWKVTNQLLCLDLSVMEWKDLTNFLPKDVPKARAGHSAVEIDKRVYIWSGRDGYRRAWNNQVCCNDLWYLDIERPPAMNRPQLLKGELKAFEIQWYPVTSADCYILQIHKYDITTFPMHYTEKTPVKLCLPKFSSSIYPLNAKLVCKDATSNQTDQNGNTELAKPQFNMTQPYLTVNNKEAHKNCSEPPPLKASVGALSKLQLVPASSGHSLLRKVPSHEVPPALKAASAISFTMPKLTNLQNNMLRPVTMSMLKLNNPKGMSEVGQKTFTVSRTTNFIKVNNAQHAMKPQTFIVKNPPFKLIAVNKDSQIKLVQSHSSHVVNRLTINPSENVAKKVDVKLSSPLPENTSDYRGLSAKKPKLSSEHEVSGSEGVNLQKSQETNESAEGSTQEKTELEKLPVLKVPSYPERVQIKKCKHTEGIYLSWTPPPGDIVTAYKVTLFVKENIPPYSGQKVLYSGVRPECYILKSHLDNAVIDDSGGTRSVKFTIAARNSAGIGPALVVKWVLHPSHAH